MALPFLIRHQSTCSCGQTRRTLQYAVIALFRPSHLSYGARLTPVPFPKGLTGGACACFHWLSGLPAQRIKRVATGEPVSIAAWSQRRACPCLPRGDHLCPGHTHVPPWEPAGQKTRAGHLGTLPTPCRQTDRQTTAHREEVRAMDGEHF